MKKSRILLSILLASFLLSCTRHIIIEKDSDIAIQNTNSKIQLKDDRSFQSRGFHIQKGEVTFQHQGKQQTLPLSEIKEITTTNRLSALGKGAAYGLVGGVLFGLVAFPFDAASAGWSIIAIPLVGLEGAVIGAASGLLIGSKRKYTVEEQ